MNQPVHEVLHAAAQPWKVGRDVLHLRDAALELCQVALHGARLHLTRRGRGENPLRGLGHPAATTAAAASTGTGAATTLMLALICRQHLSSQKPFSFYLKSVRCDSPSRSNSISISLSLFSLFLIRYTEFIIIESATLLTMFWLFIKFLDFIF